MPGKREKQLDKTRLRQFMIRNFKAFQHCTLELPPLTILIGENSSGKSSLLQALLLIKQTLEAPSGSGILRLNSHYVQIHQFREIVFGMPLTNAHLAFEFDFGEFRVGFRVGFAREGESPELLKFYINDEVLPIHDFEDLVSEAIRGWTSQRRGIQLDIPYTHYQKFVDFFRNIGYIRPIRPVPERYYPLRDIKPLWIGTQAEDIADFLDTHPPIREKARDWFVRSAKLVDQVKFKSDSKRGQMEILFTESSTGLEIDISRLGFGFSQILPIVVAAFSDMGMLIFEAPEIHLNPSLHGALTDLFIEAANNNKQVLVETHSEHVIYRIQRRVAEGMIAPEDVAIYYVKRGEAGSVAERLTLTKEGEIPNWPDGFFEAKMKDIFARVLAGAEV